MKIVLSTIFLSAVAAGLWLNRELSRLTERESVLRVEREKTRDPHSGTEESDTGSQGRPETRKLLDAAAFVNRFEQILGNHRKPSESERIELADALASASPRELKALVDELRRSNLPEEIKRERLTQSSPPAWRRASQCSRQGLSWRVARKILSGWSCGHGSPRIRRPPPSGWQAGIHRWTAPPFLRWMIPT